MTNREPEERLIDFAVLIISISNDLPETKAGQTLSGQIVKSGTSPALNYGEVRGAESRKDFIHKIQVVLKELRERFVCLKIIFKAKLNKNEQKVSDAISECNELISIFVSSVRTTKGLRK
jgi:four helix bundle protein